MSTIAVIIPAYQAEAFIRATLDSVARQTRPPEQIIVVDDGSTDATADRVEMWAVKTGIPVRLERQHNQGPSAARNKAIRLATTDYVAPLDADDLMQPWHLETLENGLKAVPRAVFAFGDQEFFEGDRITMESQLEGSALEATASEPVAGAIGFEEIDCAFNSLIDGSYVPTSGQLMRRADALKAGLYDTRLSHSEDCEFLMRLSLLGSFVYTRRQVARRRMHENQLTSRANAVKFYRNTVGNVRRFLRRSKELGLRPDMVKALSRQSGPLAHRAMYHGAIGGWQPYAETTRAMLQEGMYWHALRPDYFVRMLLYQFVTGPYY